MEDKQRRTRREFTAEFKRDAVELVRTSGRPIAHIAAELGIYDSTLGNWVRQDRIDRGEQDGLTSDEQTRLRALERENARPTTPGPPAPGRDPLTTTGRRSGWSARSAVSTPARPVSTARHGCMPSWAGVAGGSTTSGSSGSCAPMASSASGPPTPQPDPPKPWPGARAGPAGPPVRPRPAGCGSQTTMGGAATLRD
jgi:transposase